MQSLSLYAVIVIALHLERYPKTAVAQNACAHGWSYNVTGSRYLIYASSGVGYFNITMKNLHSVVTKVVRTTLPSPFLLSFLYEGLYAVSYTGITSFIYQIPLRTHKNGTVTFQEAVDPTTFRLPDQYGFLIRASVSDMIGQRIFYAVSYTPTSEKYKIIIYTPGSNRISVIYQFHYRVWDLAYDPVHRRLYILAFYMFQLDIDYQRSLAVANKKTPIPIQLPCNLIFGIKLLSLEYDCLTEYPHLHFVSQPRKRENYWRTINGTSGRCYKRRVPYIRLGHGGVRRIAFLSPWVYVYHPDNSITIYQTAKYNLTVSERISSVKVTGMTAVSPTLFSKIEEMCLMAPAGHANPTSPSEYFDSIITVSNETVKNIVAITASYNLSVLPEICRSISWPDLTIDIQTPKDIACVDCTGAAPYFHCEPDPSCKIPQAGSLNITNIEPGHNYKINLSIGNYYIGRQISPIIRQIQPFVPWSEPTDVTSTGLENGTKKVKLLAGTLITTFVIITIALVLLAKLLHRRKTKRKVSERTEIYLEQYGIQEYTRRQIKMLDPHQPVAKGEFSEVFKARIHNTPKWKHDSDGRIVAVKVLNDESMLRSEAKLMARLKHDNIVTMIGCCRDALFSCLILEWMDKGDLLSYLRSMQPDSMDISRKVKIMVEVCNGLCYLNRCGVVHRDLAARNVLCNSKDEFKIADFGLGVEMQIEKDYYRMVTERKLPMKWMAPETLIPSPKFSAMSDIWSFGVLMYEIITMGSDPYPELSLSEVSEHVREGGHPMIPQCCNAGVSDLVKRCWALKPTERISAQQLFSYLKAFGAESCQPRRISESEYVPVALVPVATSP